MHFTDLWLLLVINYIQVDWYGSKPGLENALKRSSNMSVRATVPRRMLAANLTVVRELISQGACANS